MAHHFGSTVLTRSRAAASGAVAGITLATLHAAFGPSQPPTSRLGVALVMALLCGPAGAFLGLAALVAIRTVRDMPRLGVFWMAVTVFIGAFAMSEAIEDFSTAEQFRHDGDSTVAKVIASHPDDHNTLTVGFTVAGTLVETKIAAPGGASDFEPGDRLVVYYDRTFPMRAAAIWPQW